MAGWRTGQIACVAAGLLVGLGLLRTVGGFGGMSLAVLVTGISVAAATWPVKGLSAEEWAPTVARFAVLAVEERGFRPWQASRRPSRGALASLSLLQLPGGDPIGVVVDAECGTWTAAMPVGGDGFALVSEVERDDMIAAWSGALASLASEEERPYRLQWVSRTYPARLDGPLAEPAPGELEGRGAAASYRRLLDQSAAGLWSREVLVAVTVRNAGLRPKRGAELGSDLRRQLLRLSERLRAAGLHPDRPLSPRGLARFLRRSFELSPVEDVTFWPWPIGIEEGWGWFHTDESWQASYWIAEWPRAEVGSEWMLPMLLGGDLRRTVSVTMAPVPAIRATRQAERERTSGAADAELRRRHGFAMTARARREQEGRLQREAELADGHAGFRYSGYVTVTGETFEGLSDSCRRVEHAAARSQVELRRLYGAQQDGFCCSLPLGRGCR